MWGISRQMWSVTVGIVLRSPHLTPWVTGDAWMVLHKTDCTGRREARKPLRGSCNNLGSAGRMNEHTDRWMIIEMSGSSNFCSCFHSHEKGKWLSFLFNCCALPRPHIHEWFLFCTHVSLFLKHWDLRELQPAPLVLCRLYLNNSLLRAKYPSLLNQNPQESQAENRNKQSRYSLNQNSHQLELLWDCSDCRRGKLRMLRAGKDLDGRHKMASLLRGWHCARWVTGFGGQC